ncbi:MAG: lysylphosphatidylglycerol synthase domain-containing protein [Pseudomonadota bacterium]
MPPQALGAERARDAHGRLAKPAWRRWASPAIGVALLVVVGWFMVDRGRKIDWAEVGEALRSYPAWSLAGTWALATAAHAVYAGYDLLARQHIGHRLPLLKVWAVGLVSFAVNLNLGSIVGGIGFRLRLYSKLGLEMADAGRIFAFCLVANWSGYMVLLGSLLVSGGFEPPPALGLSAAAWQAIGAALLAGAALYLAACELRGGRQLKLWRWQMELPPARMAAAQMALSMTHWLLVGSVVWTLMPRELAFGEVLGTLLSAAIAGAVVHVPGGLGVIEAVFIASFGGRVPEGALVAALLAYRAAFYLLPLAGAIVLHLALEAHARRKKGRRKSGG